MQQQHPLALINQMYAQENGQFQGNVNEESKEGDLRVHFP